MISLELLKFDEKTAATARDEKMATTTQDEKMPTTARDERMAATTQDEKMAATTGDVQMAIRDEQSRPRPEMQATTQLLQHRAVASHTFAIYMTCKRDCQ